MRMRDFIRTHRKEIDYVIREVLKAHNDGLKIRDWEREQWVMNDENLYRWAKREGVPI